MRKVLNFVVLFVCLVVCKFDYYLCEILFIFEECIYYKLRNNCMVE